VRSRSMFDEQSNHHRLTHERYCRFSGGWLGRIWRLAARVMRSGRCLNEWIAMNCVHSRNVFMV
jgi:hypothetical protein